MAIERHGAGASANPGMADDEGAQDQAGAQDENETAELPLSIIGNQAPPNPGDVIRLKVISVDQDTASITVAYDDSGSSQGSASDEMAAQATASPTTNPM